MFSFKHIENSGPVPARSFQIMWFVVCIGKIKDDPLDRVVEYFSDVLQATEFAERERNKGLACFIYQGIHYRDVV